MNEASPAPVETDPYLVEGWDARAPRPGLSKATRRRARLVAEALFTDDDGPPPPARLDWLETDLADFFGHLALRARFIFWICVTSTYVLAPLVFGRFTSFGRLPRSERVHALEAFERTPLSLALLGAKAILSIVYFEHPDAARAIGWDQGCKRP
ncbi:MAG: hypothetical protein H6719_33065 [Sandaracinaceae bacterium]|nr:hypothetical protein [Sandaracinaceae bacterium]